MTTPNETKPVRESVPTFAGQDAGIAHDELVAGSPEDLESLDEAACSGDGFPEPAPAPHLSRHLLRGAVKPLIALITTQYFIVTIVAAAGAWTVSQQASAIINTQLEAVVAALKRH